MAALQRKSHLCIPFLGIGRLPSQHSCVCERFINSQDRSTYFLQQNRQIDCGNIYVNRSLTHERGNWDCGRAISFLGIFVSNFRYWFFAVFNFRACTLKILKSFHHNVRAVQYICKKDPTVFMGLLKWSKSNPFGAA